ncbi:CAP domain-containing protein [Parvularcula oceani]|uniref:CAP domain-containing protein n=1 Tax=Parvularcula oceani TaxID=1247963 RepID=UPI0004E21031|nr:CAP domain-containing protein [Parvularcula oceani]
MIGSREAGFASALALAGICACATRIPPPEAPPDPAPMAQEAEAPPQERPAGPEPESEPEPESGLGPEAEPAMREAARDSAVDPLPAEASRAARAIDDLNAFRGSRGLPPVRLAPALSEAAEAHVEDLAARGVVTTRSLDGAGVLERVRASGYAPAAAASLVAGGYDSFEAALGAWRSDRVQKDRLLLPDVAEAGIAFAEAPDSEYRYYVELLLAEPR